MSYERNRGAEPLKGKDHDDMHAKVSIILGMAGREPDMMLSVLSYALIHATIQHDVSFSSVVRVLADIYEERLESEGEQDDDEDK
jgi:hypothetical protein